MRRRKLATVIVALLILSGLTTTAHADLSLDAMIEMREEAARRAEAWDATIPLLSVAGGAIAVSISGFAYLNVAHPRRDGFGTEEEGEE